MSKILQFHYFVFHRKFSLLKFSNFIFTILISSWPTIVGNTKYILLFFEAYYQPASDIFHVESVPIFILKKFPILLNFLDVQDDFLIFDQVHPTGA